MYHSIILVVLTYLLSTVNGLGLPWCIALHMCTKDPHVTHNNHYIGLIYESCDIMICEDYDNNFCVASDQWGHCVATKINKQKNNNFNT